MKLQKGNFYVFAAGPDLVGSDEMGRRVNVSEPSEVVMFYNLEDELEIRDELKMRLASDLEKEFWIDAMSQADSKKTNDFGAVSLSTFDKWKKMKGYE